MISEPAQNEIKALQEEHPGKSVMLVAEKGTMGWGLPHVRREQCRPVTGKQAARMCHS